MSKMIKVSDETHELIKCMSAERGMTMSGIVGKVLLKENNIYHKVIKKSDNKGHIKIDGLTQNTLYLITINEKKVSDYEEIN